MHPVVAFLNRDGHDRIATSRWVSVATRESLDLHQREQRRWRLQLCASAARDDPLRLGAVDEREVLGSAGMASLRAMLEHANRYGLKYIFVHDSYYEPLLTFIGYRKTETFNNGEITEWSKDDVPPAHRILSDAVPPAWMGLMWGTLPIGVSILAIFLVVLLPSRRGRRAIEPPIPMQEPERHYVAIEPRKTNETSSAHCHCLGRGHSPVDISWRDLRPVQRERSALRPAPLCRDSVTMRPRRSRPSPISCRTSSAVIGIAPSPALSGPVTPSTSWTSSRNGLEPMADSVHFRVWKSMRRGRCTPPTPKPRCESACSGRPL